MLLYLAIIKHVGRCAILGIIICLVISAIHNYYSESGSLLLIDYMWRGLIGLVAGIAIPLIRIEKFIDEYYKKQDEEADASYTSATLK